MDSKLWKFNKYLGEGGFGTTELWINEKTLEKIAIKKCKYPELNQRQKERWIHEVEILNKLSHNNIISTKNIPDLPIKNDSGLPILLMEYCNNGDLRKVLNKPENFCGLREQDAFKVMSDVSSAVEYLHKFEITHRDLKPENIVIQQEFDKVTYKLIDLGYAKELGPDSLSASIVGTLNYIAPELFWKKDYSCTVDYWGLGILFYEVLTGTRPFLPNIPMSLVWVNHVKNKPYEHISARETDGKVQFYNDLDDPNRISACIRKDLVDWFRVVLQWDPKRRGKVKNSAPNDPPVVFTMLKSILETLILRVFIVPLAKFEAYIIDFTATIRQVKQMIAGKEGIDVEDQVLTDADGKLLPDYQACSDGNLLEKTVFLFSSERILLVDILKTKLSRVVNEIIFNPRKNIYNHNFKRYFGAVILFIKQELDIYETFIMGLSIMIDLADMRVKSLENEIRQLIGEIGTLINDLELISKCLQANSQETFEKINNLATKINNLSNGTKNIEKEFNILAEVNKEMKEFPELSSMEAISKPYDDLLNLFHLDRTSRCKCSTLAKQIYSFLEIRNQQLKNPEFTGTVGKLKQFRERISQSEKVVDSVKQLSIAYREEVDKLKENIPRKIVKVEECPPSNESLTFYDPNDSVIMENCIITNLFGEQLSNLEGLSSQLFDLDEFNF